MSRAHSARHVRWDELRDIVHAREFVLLYVSAGAAPEDPDLVSGHFHSIAATVWTELRTLRSPGDATARAWMESELARLGDPQPRLRPGYYLFARGKLCSHDSGLPDVTHDPKAMAAFLATLLGRAYGVDPLVQGASFAAHAGVASRIIAKFSSKLSSQERAGAEAASERRRDAPRQQAHRPPPAPEAPTRDELAVAFEVIYLPINADQVTVKNRFRALAKQWHPDRLAGDRQRERDGALRMQHINVAYAVICRARGWK